jgi:hypothetical protein
MKLVTAPGYFVGAPNDEYLAIPRCIVVGMAGGDCESAFWNSAREDGLDLVRYKKPWINQQGHFGLPPEADPVVKPLHDIFLNLGGNSAEQAAKRPTPLPGDFIHPETGTIIEIDEPQHFTSFRLQTFNFYPSNQALGYEDEPYRRLCQSLSGEADAYFRTKTAAAFGVGGRQRQRAYYDALRDLTVPIMGLPPVIRIAAADRDGAAAYCRNRDMIRDRLSST